MAPKCCVTSRVVLTASLALHIEQIMGYGASCSKPNPPSIQNKNPTKMTASKP